MRIPIDNLADSFMPSEEKERLKELLKKEGLPPLVTITHVVVSPNPHHDTAVVQYFWKNKLYPWIWENTVGLEGGNMFVRSDNCGGRFKSGRHFRFISEHSSLPHSPSRGMKLFAMERTSRILSAVGASFVWSKRRCGTLRRIRLR